MLEGLSVVVVLDVPVDVRMKVGSVVVMALLLPVEVFTLPTVVVDVVPSVVVVVVVDGVVVVVGAGVVVFEPPPIH